MASHDLALRANITLNEGVTLAQVWDALCDFAEDRSIELDELPDTETGDILFVNPNNVVTLAESRVLFIYLAIRGMGHGTWPDSADEMLKRLGALCNSGGAVELFDTDVSATNDDESRAVRFIGPSDRSVRAARVRYGLSQAEEWLEPVIGKLGFDAVSKAALRELESIEAP